MDIDKRNMAKSNNLNYVVFWDNDLRDAFVWFAFDCPDAKDYDNMYSWFYEPFNIFEYYELINEELFNE